MARDLLFEIGIEEIPARFMEPALNQLKELSSAALEQAGLAYEDIQVYGTPRRIALLVKALAEIQPDSQAESKGPAVKAAYAPDGSPSKALLGFCRGQGITPEQVLQKEIKGVPYVYALKEIKGKPTAELLPPLLEEIVHKLYFPKPMRWGNQDMRFARPIRWLVLLFGGDVLPLEIAGVKAGRVTRGHRFLGNGQVEIKEPGAYLMALQNEYVIVDQKLRREKIWAQIKAVAKVAGGIVKPDEELLAELVYILEYPTALLGSFDVKYLNIPEELVVTPMREHQRYFPVYNKSGKQLLPHFITVRNGNSEHLNIVRAGNEKVLAARLADAAFFWEEDCSHRLESNLPRLEHIVFHEKLGTLSAKVERVKTLAGHIAAKLVFNEIDCQDTQRAATLMKCDLVSNAVYEFTELQGIMGEYYALHDRENKQVAQAIREHYLPRFAGDALPETKAGMALALADRLDSLVGFFAQDLIPTGSQDPYALRRAAIGVTQILLQNKLGLNLHWLCQKAYDLYTGVAMVNSREKTLQALESFFRQRLENVLSEEGVAYDVINAVASLPLICPLYNYQKAHALAAFKQDADFPKLMAAYGRAANLLKNVEAPKEARKKLLEEPAEKDLYEVLHRVHSQVLSALARRDYLAALRDLAMVRPPLDAFFEEVLVMAEDEKIRGNRLALLKMLVDMTADLGNLSALVH